MKGPEEKRRTTHLFDVGDAGSALPGVLRGVEGEAAGDARRVAPRDRAQHLFVRPLADAPPRRT